MMDETMSQPGGGTDASALINTCTLLPRPPYGYGRDIYGKLLHKELGTPYVRNECKTYGTMLLPINHGYVF